MNRHPVGVRGDIMENCGYHSDELKQLRSVLDSIIAEAKERGLDLPVEDIIERMFGLADEGERDPERLRAAVLGELISASEAAREKRIGWRVTPRNG
jgi:hypothetical protein